MVLTAPVGGRAKEKEREVERRERRWRQHRRHTAHNKQLYHKAPNHPRKDQQEHNRNPPKKALSQPKKT
jgi:hypothetical protein